VVAIQIRGVSDETRNELAEQAKARGQSLQAYLLEVLNERADAGHNRRLLAEWARHPLVSGSEPFDSVGYIRQLREEREQDLTRRATSEPG
jgi:antitoxin FitA